MEKSGRAVVSHRSRALEGINPQEITFEEKRKESYQIASIISWAIGVLIICQEKDSGSGLGLYGE